MARTFKCAGGRRDPPVCDYEAEARWLGRCPRCGGNYDIVKTGFGEGEKARTSLASLAIKPIERISTGIAEFDRILGGGLVPGSSVLLAGEPGAGKSTLLVQALDNVAKGKRCCLYTSGEQSQEDIGGFAARIGALNPEVDVMGNECDVEKVVAAAEERKPTVLVVDSINTALFEDVDSDVGSTAQMKAAATYYTSFGKAEKVALIIVCQVTKTGDLSGPKTLEHLVDTVCYFDFYGSDDEDADPEETGDLRVISVGKNRNGPSNLRAVLEMTASGLKTPSKKKSKYLTLV